MALANLLTLLTFATSALIVSNPTPVTALSIDGQHLAVRSHHGAVARKRRSNTSQRCKPRSTTSASPTSTKAASTSASSAASTKSAAAAAKVATTASSSKSSAPTQSSSSSSGGVARGLAWATDNTWASGLNVPWYHHWNDPPVPQLSSAEYVPELWGSSHISDFQNVMSNLGYQPQHIMGFNEPDIPSQSNMSPDDAAGVWMQYIHPWGQKGVTLVSPCIAFDTTWLQSFKSAIAAQGGYFDKTCVHWYGGHDQSSISQLQSYVGQAHSLFGQGVWITEFGLTQASNPSLQDAAGFFQQMIGYFDSVGYVERVAVFGAFAQSQPIDDFSAANNAFFFGQNDFTPLGDWYLNK